MVGLLSFLFVVSPVQEAIDKALRYIDRTAQSPELLQAYGHDLLWCLSSVARTSRDEALAARAMQLGQGHARAWRTMSVGDPLQLSADDLTKWVMADHAANTLGVVDVAFTQALRSAARRFSASDFYGADPKRSVDAWSDALISTYFGDADGVTLGVSHRVIAASPPPSLRQCNNLDVFYALTHVIYTRNDYGARTLAPANFQRELRCIRTHLSRAMRTHDAEVVGEALDTLKALGFSQDPEVRAATTYLVRTQRADGTWGHDDDDVYTRYHSAWTGLDGLREFRF